MRMRKLFPYFFILLTTCFATQTWAQKGGKKKAKADQATLSNMPAGDPGEQVHPEKEKQKTMQRLEEASKSEKAARLATAPSTVNADHLKKIQANLAEDGAGNLVQPVIIIPTTIKDKDQKAAFALLKKLVEEENAVSTYIKTTDGDKIAFVIGTKEAFEKWMASKPELLLAYVFQGTASLESSTVSQVIRMREKYGVHKLVDMQLKKRTTSQFVPTKVKIKEDVSESLPQ